MRMPNVPQGQWPVKTVIKKKRRYIEVSKKFWLGHGMALIWLLFSILVSIPWLNDLGSLISKPLALILIGGIGYIPGYINMFIAVSLLFDRQPQFMTTNPTDPVTIIIACRNEEKSIGNTLRYIKAQDYQGLIQVIVVDNALLTKQQKQLKRREKTSESTYKSYLKKSLESTML